jgi:hypothetical protein
MHKWECTYWPPGEFGKPHRRTVKGDDREHARQIACLWASFNSGCEMDVNDILVRYVSTVPDVPLAPPRGSAAPGGLKTVGVG